MGLLGVESFITNGPSVSFSCLEVVGAKADNGEFLKDSRRGKGVFLVSLGVFGIGGMSSYLNVEEIEGYAGL
jgi:hypothetical protein